MVHRVALVGCGSMGRSHLRTIEALPDFEAVGVCDLFPESAEKAGEEFGITVRGSDAEEMYESLAPDLVVIVTETRGHHAPTIAALDRGIPVLCEKPIAIDLTEADEMVAASERSGAKLSINQQHHVGPPVLKTLEMVEEGKIGDVVLVRGRNKCGRKSGNEFMEMGTHVTNYMMRFGGTPVWCAGSISVDGRLGGPDDIMEAKEMSPKDRDSGLVMGERSVATYGFDSGALGEIHFLGHEVRETPNYGVDIEGSEGCLSIRLNRVWHLPRPMEGLPDGGGDWELVYDGDAEEGDQGPVAEMYVRLMQAVRDDSDAPCSGQLGRLGFEMIMGIYESHRRSGARVEIPLENREHPLERWRREESEI